MDKYRPYTSRRPNDAPASCTLPYGWCHLFPLFYFHVRGIPRMLSMIIFCKPFMKTLIRLHHCNVDDELYKKNPIFYIFFHEYYCTSWDPHVIAQSCDINKYLYYEFSVQKFIKQMPPTECSSYAKREGLDSVKYFIKQPFVLGT